MWCVCVCARMHVVCVCERMPARCGVCVCTQINIHIWRKVRLDRASVPAFFISYLTCHSVVVVTAMIQSRIQVHLATR